MNPWPGAYAGAYKVLEAEAEPWAGDEAPGTVLRADAKQGLWVRAGEGALNILRMQAAGGKPPQKITASPDGRAIVCREFFARFSGRGQEKGVGMA